MPNNDKTKKKDTEVPLSYNGITLTSDDDKHSTIKRNDKVSFVAWKAQTVKDGYHKERLIKLTNVTRVWVDRDEKYIFRGEYNNATVYMKARDWTFCVDSSIEATNCTFLKVIVKK